MFNITSHEGNANRNRNDKVPTVMQWVKDSVLPQLWCRSQLQLRFRLWPRNSICHGCNKKKKKHNEVSANIHQNAYHQKEHKIKFILKKRTKITNAGKDIEKMEPPYMVGSNVNWYSL